MTLFKIIKNLSFRKTQRLFLAMLSKPLFLIPTVLATVESIIYSELYFDENHSGRGVANAFRHASWTVLIAKNVEYLTTKQKAMDWAEWITNLHEEVFYNTNDFDRLMDLHNNEIGRKFYNEHSKEEKLPKRKLMKKLVEKSQHAIGLETASEISSNIDELVFLKNWYK